MEMVDFGVILVEEVRGDSLSLYRRVCLFYVLIGAREGYSLTFLSNISGMMDTKKHCELVSLIWLG